MNKYLPAIKQLNDYLREFNTFLRPEVALPLLNEQEANNDQHFLTLTGKKWGTFDFPRGKDSAGVYFYFGTAENTSAEMCVYIGKASLSRRIGHRLWTHFRRACEEDRVIMKSADGRPFVIDLIGSIPIEDVELTFLAPSLEEFLISRLKRDGYHLLNKNGNR